MGMGFQVDTPFDNGSFLQFEGDGRAWVDYNFGVGSARGGSTAPDLISLNATDILVYGFNGVNTTETVHFSIEMNHNWAEETIIYPHVHWYPTTTGAGGVVWSLEYEIVPEDSTSPAGASSTTIQTLIQSAGGTAWVPKFVNFPTISMVGNKIGTQAHFRFFRDPADDDYGADAALATVGIHVLVDSLGSSEIASK